MFQDHPPGQQIPIGEPGGPLLVSECTTVIVRKSNEVLVPVFFLQVLSPCMLFVMPPILDLSLCSSNKTWRATGSRWFMSCSLWGKGRRCVHYLASGKNMSEVKYNAAAAALLSTNVDEEMRRPLCTSTNNGTFWERDRCKTLFYSYCCRLQVLVPDPTLEL